MSIALENRVAKLEREIEELKQKLEKAPAKRKGSRSGQQAQ